MDLATLGALTLIDHDGAPHRLRDEWAERAVVLVFLRHFGWLHCREHAAQLRDANPEIERRGAHVVAIGTGDTRYAAAFVRDERVPFTVLVDDDGAAARAAAVRTVPFVAMFTPRTWKATVDTWRRGHRIHKAGRRVTQQGGTWVIGPGDVVRYEHVDRDSTDHASVADVLAALDAQLRA